MDIVKCPTRVCSEETMSLSSFWGNVLIVSQLRDRICLEVWVKYRLLLCKIIMKSLLVIPTEVVYLASSTCLVLTGGLAIVITCTFVCTMCTK